MANYTKEEIAKLYDELRERAAVLEKSIRPKVKDIVALAQNAETLADHAAYKDMNFTATTLLSLASRMNRLLIFCK